MCHRRFIIGALLIALAVAGCEPTETPTPTPVSPLPSPTPTLTSTAFPTSTMTPSPSPTDTPQPTPTYTPGPTQPPTGDGALTVWGDEYKEFELLSHTPGLWLDLEVRDDSGAVLYTEMQDTGQQALDIVPVGLVGIFTPTLPASPTGEIWIYPYYHAPEDAWIGYVGTSGAYTEAWIDVPLIYDIDCLLDERGFCYYATTMPEAGVLSMAQVFARAAIIFALLFVGIWLFSREVVRSWARDALRR